MGFEPFLSLTSLARSHVFTESVTLARIRCMARVTVTFTISLPPEMAESLEEVMKREHRTRSELVREALRRYASASNKLAAESI